MHQNLSSPPLKALSRQNPSLVKVNHLYLSHGVLPDHQTSALINIQYQYKAVLMLILNIECSI